MVRCHTHLLARSHLPSVFAQKVASASGTYSSRPTIFRTARCLRSQILTSAISPSANLIKEKNRSSCGVLSCGRCPQTHGPFLVVITAGAPMFMTTRLPVVEYSCQPNAANHHRSPSPMSMGYHIYLAVMRWFECCRACAMPGPEGGIGVILGDRDWNGFFWCTGGEGAERGTAAP